MVLKSNIRSSASPRPALQHDSEYFFVTLEVYLKTLFSKIFCFSDFFSGTGRDGTDGTGQTGQTDKHMDRQTFLGKYYFRLDCIWYCLSILIRLCTTLIYPFLERSVESVNIEDSKREVFSC